MFFERSDISIAVIQPSVFALVMCTINNASTKVQEYKSTKVQEYKSIKVQNTKSKGRFPCSTNSQKYVKKRHTTMQTYSNIWILNTKLLLIEV